MEKLFKVQLLEFGSNKVLVERLFSENINKDSIQSLVIEINDNLNVEKIITMVDDDDAWEYAILITKDGKTDEIFKYSIAIIYNDCIKVNVDCFDENKEEYRIYIFTASEVDYDCTQDAVVLAKNIKEAYEMAKEEIQIGIDLVDIRNINKSKIIFTSILYG